MSSKHSYLPFSRIYYFSAFGRKMQYIFYCMKKEEGMPTAVPPPIMQSLTYFSIAAVLSLISFMMLISNFSSRL